MQLGAEFGFALAAGNIAHPSGADNLVIGSPLRNNELNADPDVGYIVMGKTNARFRRGFERGDTSRRQ